MHSAETCECRYDDIGGHLIWCLGCREAEEARKLAPRPGRIARLRAWLTATKTDTYRSVKGPARFDMKAGTPATVFGMQVHLAEPGKVYVSPSVEKALDAMLAGLPRWKWLALRGVYYAVSAVCGAVAMVFVQEAWQAGTITSAAVPAAWFFYACGFAMARKGRTPTLPLQIRLL